VDVDAPLCPCRHVVGKHPDGRRSDDPVVADVEDLLREGHAARQHGFPAHKCTACDEMEMWKLIAQ